MKKRKIKILVLLLTIVGGILSVYLILHHLRLHYGCLSQPSSCSIAPGFNCDVVAASSYATLFGIPVANFGLLYYTILLLLLITPQSFKRSWIEELPLGLSLFGLLGSIYFASISAFVIRSLCLHCSGTYVVNVLTFFILILTVPKGQRLIALKQSLFSGFRVLANALTFRSGREGRITLLTVVIAIVFSVPLPAWLGPFACDSKILAASAKAVQDWHQAPPISAVLAAQDLRVTDFSDGPLTASVVVMIFSDFECPHCRLAAKTLRTIRELHPHTTRIVFKNFPLDAACNPAVTKSFHRFSCRAASYARCAGASSPEGFWLMHDKIFALPRLSEEALRGERAAINLSASDFEHCLLRPETLAPIAADIQLGRELGLKGTPAIFINGKRLSELHLSAIQEIVTWLLRNTQESNN